MEVGIPSKNALDIDILATENLNSSQDDFNDLKFEYINDYEAVLTAISDFESKIDVLIQYKKALLKNDVSKVEAILIKNMEILEPILPSQKE